MTYANNGLDMDTGNTKMRLTIADSLGELRGLIMASYLADVVQRSLIVYVSCITVNLNSSGSLSEKYSQASSYTLSSAS